MVVNKEPHFPVLLSEFLKFFEGRSLSVFVDGTLGAGGHSAAILSKHPELQTLIGIDQDAQARAIAKEKLSPWAEKLKLVEGNFTDLKAHLERLGVAGVDGLFFDLGVSSMQLDWAERGFSFLKEGPLDMRMDPSHVLTAEEIVNEWSEQELGRIFRDYGEEDRWRIFARTIVAARPKKRITTTQELVELLTPLFPSPEVIRRKKLRHPMTLVFQALRLCVNRELEVLEALIPQAISLLNQGGRLGIISYHSLEDRIVKNLFRESASDKVNTSGIGGLFLDKEPLVELLGRKPIIPTDEEMEKNPRSRSAKMRFVEKL